MADRGDHSLHVLGDDEADPVSEGLPVAEDDGQTRLEERLEVDLARPKPDHNQALYAAASTTPATEKEVGVIANRTARSPDVAPGDEEFIDAIAAVLRAFIDHLGVLSFNLALYLALRVRIPIASDREVRRRGYGLTSRRKRRAVERSPLSRPGST